MRLARARVPDQTHWITFGDPFAGGEIVDDRRFDIGIDAVVELPQRLLAGEVSRPDASLGPAPVPVLALGQQQLGEEPGIGQALSFGPGDRVGGLGSRGR